MIKLNRLTLVVLISTWLVAACDEGRDDSSETIDWNCMQLAAGTYPPQSTAPYILPYSVGETYTVGQGNCTTESHTAARGFQFAYDFLMPIGTAIIASRGGEVVALEERFVDGTRNPGEENFVLIQHDDGTFGGYFHLTTLGALVELQDTVAQGDIIAMSGDSGSSSEPHLHFEATEGVCLTPQVPCVTLPVNFSNTRPHVNGLLDGQRYSAEQF